MDNVGTVIGPIANGSTTDDPRPVVNGTGVAGNTIRLYDGSTLIGSTVIGADGKWSLQPNVVLLPGAHDLYATQSNAVGTSAASTHTAFTLDTETLAKPGKPVITDNTGEFIPPGGTTPHMGGTGKPGDTITVYDNGTPIGSTVIGPDGKWSYTIDPALTRSNHAITVVETSSAGVPSVPSDRVIQAPIPNC